MPAVRTTASAMPASFLFLVNQLGAELREFLAAEMFDAERRLLCELTLCAFHKSPRVCESLLQEPCSVSRCSLAGAHHLLFLLCSLHVLYRRSTPEALCATSPLDVRGGTRLGQALRAVG